MWVKDYKTVTENGWNIFSECLLKVILYPSSNDFDILFVNHHLLGDGKSILGLMEEFVNCYVSDKVPVFVEEHLINSIDDLPLGSDLSLISKLIVGKANRDWRKESHEVSYEEYLDFEKNFINENPTQYEEEKLESSKVKKLLNICRENAITINDYLVAEMMNQEQTKRVVIAADIREQVACYQKGSLGNFATAISIKNASKTNDIIQKAKKSERRLNKT